VLAAAQQQRIRRTVHLSSVAVYGKAAAMIDERHPHRSRGNYYAHCKIEAERVCDEFMSHGVPVVVLRPSIIYGPFSEAWTVSFARRLMSGKWGTFGHQGQGLCNLVYVTDVVQAIVRALDSDRAVGQCFNVSGSEVITWNDYFSRFNDALQRDPLRELRVWPLALKARILSPARSLAKFALARYAKSITTLHAKSALAATYMSRTESTLKLTPTREQLKLYGVRAQYSIEKARDQLGFVPKVDIGQGLRWSVEWLRQQGLLDQR
jgi:nucleoside-diphosphate-sugar epimerase